MLLSTFVRYHRIWYPYPYNNFMSVKCYNTYVKILQTFHLLFAIERNCVSFFFRFRYRLFVSSGVFFHSSQTYSSVMSLIRCGSIALPSNDRECHSECVSAWNVHYHSMNFSIRTEYALYRNIVYIVHLYLLITHTYTSILNVYTIHITNETKKKTRENWQWKWENRQKWMW